jgi:hypothetical protein
MAFARQSRTNQFRALKLSGLNLFTPQILGCKMTADARAFSARASQHKGPGDEVDLANIINGIVISPTNDSLLWLLNDSLFLPLATYFFACTDFGSDEPTFTVTGQDVCMKLSKVNPAKGNGADGILSWVLKENADLLADPVKGILNLSYRNSYLPQSWKEADIVTLPKQKPVKDVNKHLRPIH